MKARCVISISLVGAALLSAACNRTRNDREDNVMAAPGRDQPRSTDASAAVSPGPGNQPSTPGATGPTGNAEPSGGTGAASDLSDAQIFAVADAANAGEVDQATLARLKAHAGSVKTFASGMITDHGAAKKKGRELSKELGIPAQSSAFSAGLERDSESIMSDLRRAEGDAFDRVYMQTQVKEHQQVLKMIDDQLLPQADAPKLKDLLTDMRTTVQKHLDHAQAVLSELGSKSHL